MSAVAVPRRISLTDEEILARARSVFVDRGYAARTWQVAAAVGLTWGAISLRFGNKASLFAHAMAGPDEPAPPLGAAADLPNLLERLRTYLWQRWPRCLQLRLAARTAGPADEVDGLVRWLAPAMGAHAQRGSIRSDIEPEALARVVVALLIGDAARGFVAGERVPKPDRALSDSVLRLLTER
jgi:AcrR family transcriptional regulator